MAPNQFEVDDEEEFMTPDVEDEETDDDESESEASEEEDDDEDAEANAGLPVGIQRRLAKITKARKSAEKRASQAEAELARLKERSGENSPQLLMALVQKHGVLPQLMDKETIRSIREVDELEERTNALNEILDEMEDRREDEITLDKRTYTRAELRKQLRDNERRLAELKDDAVSARKALGKRVANLIKLGLEAEQNAKVAKKKAPPKKHVLDDEDDEEEELTRQPRKKRRLNDWSDERDASTSREPSRDELLRRRRKLVSGMY